MTSLPNFIKIYQLVQKLLVGDTQTVRQTDERTDSVSFATVNTSKLHKVAEPDNLGGGK
jgi:hypothetical protein